MASIEDRRKIETKLRSEGIAVPCITEDTIVVLDEDEKVVAFVALMYMPFLYYHWDENLRGHRLAMKLPEMMDVILKSRGHHEVFTGVDQRVPVMVKTAERFGFHWWGEALYHKYVDPILKRVAHGQAKQLK